MNEHEEKKLTESELSKMCEDIWVSGRISEVYRMLREHPELEGQPFMLELTIEKPKPKVWW